MYRDWKIVKDQAFKIQLGWNRHFIKNAEIKIEQIGIVI